MMRWTKHWLISEVARLLGPMILVYTALTVFVFRNVIPHFISALVGPPEDNVGLCSGTHNAEYF
jgi:hypothetical protein